MIVRKTGRAFAPFAVIAALAVLGLAGCGSADRNVALVTGYQPAPKSTIAVAEVVDAAPKGQRGEEHKDYDAAGKLRAELQAKLREAGLADASGGAASLALSVRIVEYHPGDAFKRWLLPGYGSTVLAVEGTLRDAGRQVATLTARRSVDAGGAYTIGAWESIFGSVAEDLVAELKQKLRPGAGS